MGGCVQKGGKEAGRAGFCDVRWAVGGIVAHQKNKTSSNTWQYSHSLSHASASEIDMSARSIWSGSRRHYGYAHHVTYEPPGPIAWDILRRHLLGCTQSGPSRVAQSISPHRLEPTRLSRRLFSSSSPSAPGSAASSTGASPAPVNSEASPRPPLRACAAHCSLARSKSTSLSTYSKSWPTAPAAELRCPLPALSPIVRHSALAHSIILARLSVLAASLKT